MDDKIFDNIEEVDLKKKTKIISAFFIEKN